MLFFEKIVKYDAPYGRNVPLRGMCCFAECGRFAHQPKAAHWREATILHEVHHIEKFTIFAKSKNIENGHYF